MKDLLRKLPLVLALVFTVTSTHAQMLRVDELSMNKEVKQSLSQKVASEIDKPEVRAQVEKMGLNPQEAQKRILALSDNEIRQAVNGGDEVGADVVVISLTTVLLVVIIVLLID